MAGDSDRQLEYFNEAFYRADPAEYLRTKLNLLLLASARPAELNGLFRAGFEHAGIAFSPEQDDDAEDEGDDESYRSFRTIEAIRLHHHAAETLVRLYIAHLNRPAAPWTDVAERTTFWRFKRTVQETILDMEPADGALGFVFLGRTTPGDMGTDVWSSWLESLRAFLQHAASTFLDARVYNAIKHGLGVAAGAAQLSIGGISMGFGTSVDIPKRSDESDWRVETNYVSPEISMRHVWIIAEMIDLLWTVGRGRCLGATGEVIRLRFPANLRPEDLERDVQRSSIRRFSLFGVTVTKPAD